MLKHAEAMSHTSSRDSRRKLQEDYNRVAGAYKSAATSNQEEWKKSVNSLDYEEIEPRSYERIKGSSLKVKSVENNLQKVGVPKAVWEQPGRKSMNIYNAHTASEMGYPYSSEQKSAGTEPLPKYYLTRNGSEMSLNTIGTTAYCDTEWSGATFDLENDSDESTDGYSYASSSPTTSIGVARVYHTPAPKYASPPPPPPVQPQVVHVKHSVRNPDYPPPPVHVMSQPKKEPSSRVPLKYEGSEVDAKYHQGRSQRLSSYDSAKSIPPPVPATPPVTVSQKRSEQNVHQNPLAKMPTRVAPNAKKVEPVRWAANGDMIPGQDPNYFIEGGVYVPQYYHEQLWRCPSLKPKLNIPDPKSPAVQSPSPGSENDIFDSTRSSEGDEYMTPRVKEVDTVSIALSANLGDESLRTLSKEQRKKAEQNLKTILVNQKLLQSKTDKEKSQKEDEAKKNAQNILNTLRKKQVADEVAEQRRRDREIRKKKAERYKREKDLQRKLEKAKKQKEREARKRERERRSSTYSDRSQRSHNGFDDAQAEEARRLLREVKRLSEEKAILTLQRNSSGSSTRLEETVEAGAGVNPKKENESDSEESFASELSAVVEEPSVVHTEDSTPEIAIKPPIPPQRNLSTQNHEVTPPPPEYENAKPRPSVDSMGSSQSKKNKMVIPNHNGDDSVKVLSYTRTDKTQAQAPANEMKAVPVRNQLYSSSEDERFTSEDESTIVDEPPTKQAGVTAGVQTGRDSIITKAKISPPRESLNLSDLSDEEVDRLTQLGLSFGPSKVTGQRLTQESQVSIFSL